MTTSVAGRGEPGSAVAVVPVRSGLLPVGADETVAEAGGRCWLVGSGCDDALAALRACVTEATLVETGPGPMTAAVRTELVAALQASGAGAVNLILPASPDGRDLAPHLAAALARPLVAGATEVAATWAIVARHGGRTMETLALHGPVVATLQPGARAVPPGEATAGTDPVIETLHVAGQPNGGVGAGEPGRVELLAELPADPATMDLADAPRIVGGGAGLGTAEDFDALHRIAAMLGASVGATRVVTDQGWLPTERQIGTTGVTVDPDLYLAVGISGAVQHTAGLGTPAHVVVINTDPSCPMMDLADLAIVCDGPAFLAGLESVLARRAAARPHAGRQP